jgi:hypothetical protein
MSASWYRARGAVNLLAVMFLIAVIMAVLATTLTMTSSDILDSTAQSNSVRALFLAETAAERAAGRMAGGTACASLAPESTSLGSGTLNIVSASVVGANCQIRVSGTVSGATRTVDVQIANTGSTIALEQANNFPNTNTNGTSHSRSVPMTIGGTGRVLVVAVTTDTANNTIGSVTYAGTALGFRAGVNQTGGGSKPRMEIWTLADNPVGTIPVGPNNVVVTFAGDAGVVDQMEVGAMSFTGVDVSTATSHLDVWPLPASAVKSGTTGTTASVTITPVTSGAWIVDGATINGGSNASPILMTVMATRLQRWNQVLSTSIAGAGSTLGPINPAIAKTLTWTWSGNQKWAQIAIALRPGGTPRVVQWSEVVN